MRELLRPELGRRLAHRRKQGFEIPVDRWFREPETTPIREELLSGTLVGELGFDRAAIQQMINRHLSGEDLGRKLFALTALESWGRHFA
jgi:hypothetical protein